MLSSFVRDALAQAPTLSYLAPAAIRPGQSIDVSFRGANLAGPTGVWISAAGVQAELATTPPENGKNADLVTYRMTAEKELPLGIHGVRVATGTGISNLRLLMIDDLPSATDAGNNHTPQSAQLITVGSAVDGVCEPEASDFYKLMAVAGQQVSIEIVARRLGSPLDPVIRLLDVRGTELASSDDEPGISADCRLAHTFRAAGEYFIELRDIRYLGGGDYRYRLRIGNFPLVHAAYPLAVVRGGHTEVQPLGLQENIPLMRVAGPTLPPIQFFNATVAYPQPGPSASPLNESPIPGSSWIALISSVSPDQLEKEPNDSPNLSTPGVLAGAISGRLEAARDRDFYQFEAKAGQRIRFVGQTRKLASPTDLFMRLFKPDGSLLVEVDDTGADEGILDAQFPADGIYRLMVEDVNRRGGPQHVYRVTIEPYRAGFLLAVENEKYDAPAAGSFAAKITCARRDYNGPIEISVDHGEGWGLENNIIPEGKNETVLTVTLPPALQSGTPTDMRFVGRAKIGDHDVVETASTLLALRKGLSGLPYPPAELDGHVGIGVGPVFPDFFELAIEPPTVVWSDTSKAATLKLKATRTGGFDDKIQLGFEGLPTGVSVKPSAIEKGQAEVGIELTPAAQPIAAGEYKLRITATATFQIQRKKRTSEVQLTVPPAK